MRTPAHACVLVQRDNIYLFFTNGADAARCILIQLKAFNSTRQALCGIIAFATPKKSGVTIAASLRILINIVSNVALFADLSVGAAGNTVWLQIRAGKHGDGT